MQYPQQDPAELRKSHTVLNQRGFSTRTPKGTAAMVECYEQLSYSYFDNLQADGAEILLCFYASGKFMRRAGLNTVKTDKKRSHLAFGWEQNATCAEYCVKQLDRQGKGRTRFSASVWDGREALRGC